MEIFYSDNISLPSVVLTEENSLHCARVLRHRTGDSINVIDGKGTMYVCEITDDNPKKVCAVVRESFPGWHSHPYRLAVAVCPTKNIDRFEWFVEKATETGVDSICPVIGDRSERKVIKTDRIEKIALSAARQSLKSSVPVVEKPVSVREFILSCSSPLKLIAYCFEDGAHPRTSVASVLSASADVNDIAVLIGPEGDFSPEEASLAIENGWIPIHLGESRLRTETAALMCVSSVYIAKTL